MALSPSTTHEPIPAAPAQWNGRVEIARLMVMGISSANDLPDFPIIREKRVVTAARTGRRACLAYLKTQKAAGSLAFACQSANTRPPAADWRRGGKPWD